METMLIDGLILAGVLALIALPFAGMEIARLGRVNRDLAERNATQAASLGALQRRIDEGQQRRRMAMPMMGEGPAEFRSDFARWRDEVGGREAFDRESG